MVEQQKSRRGTNTQLDLVIAEASKQQQQKAERFQTRETKWQTANQARVCVAESTARSTTRAQANQAPSRGSVTWRPPPRKYLARGPGYRVPTCHAIRAAHAHISSTRAEIFQNPAQAPAAAGFAGNPPGFGATANSPLHHLHAGAGSPNPRRGDQYDRRAHRSPAPARRGGVDPPG